jgi:hypothetical protein
MTGRERTGAELADEVLKPEVAAMLEGGQSREQIVYALLMMAYEVFGVDMAMRPPRVRAAMFAELARGNAVGMERLPRDTPLPRVRQPTGGKGWRVEGEDGDREENGG